MPIRYTNELLDSSMGIPPLGCRYCDRGAKMVLYITGICKQECFYCPLSEKKKDKDVIYANERKVEGGDWSDRILDEAKRMKALGTGITGGDPMVVPERTMEIIKVLKNEFGVRHHIHLYTTGPFDMTLLPDMKESGLDEIRFHPPVSTWPSFTDPANGSSAPYHELIMKAKEADLVTGLEIPAVVDVRCQGEYSKGLEELAQYAIKNGLEFVNINELEASHTNMKTFKERGYELVGDSMAVKGSRELALSVMDKMQKKYPESGTVLHLCTSVYKDSVQLRHRLKRTADNIKGPYDTVTDDGTLLRGIIETDVPDRLRNWIIETFEVPVELMDIRRNKLQIAAWVLEEIGPELEEECYISEVYPTWDSLEVERMPVR